MRQRCPLGMNERRQGQIMKRAVSVALFRWVTTEGLPFPTGATRVGEEVVYNLGGGLPTSWD